LHRKYYFREQEIKLATLHIKLAYIEVNGKEMQSVFLRNSQGMFID